jgi:hypothetical protein
MIEALQVPPSPTDQFMIDLETGGTAYGSVILEIAVAEFNPKTGEILRHWSTNIDLMDSLQHGLTMDEETSAWHKRKGTDVWKDGIELWKALNTLYIFLHLNSDRPTVWAWGIDFETMMLKGACEAAGYKMPWHYSDGRCARTIWQASPIEKERQPVKHRAMADVRAQVEDLTKALKAFEL